MNPNRIRKEYLPLFIRHNQEFYGRLDMSLSPMVLDFREPSGDVLDAFASFSPDGFATVVMDLHDKALLQKVRGGKVPDPYELKGPHVWKGMPVMGLLDAACNTGSVDQASEAMSGAIPAQLPGKPGFYLFRLIYKSPGHVVQSIDRLRKKRPDLDIEVVDPYSFFRMYRDYHQRG